MIEDIVFLENIIDERNDEINALKLQLQKLLSPPEQEPVAWMSLSDIEWMNIVNHPKILELTGGRHNSEEAVNLAVKMTEEKCKKNNSDSIPKREPLSDKDVGKGFLLTDVWHRYECFIAGVKWAEHQHGIRSFDDETK
jgi:hypothetical protein